MIFLANNLVTQLNTLDHTGDLRMIRKEPPLTLNKSEKQSAPAIIEPRKNQKSDLIDKYDGDFGLSTSKALGANGVVEPKNIFPEKSNNAARAGGTISIWIPAVLYVASGVFPFLNKIDFQLENLIKLYLMLGEHTGVIISEYILVSFLQPAILFVFVSLLLFCLRMIGLGKGLNFRRGTHILFSILLSVAYLAKPFYAA